MYTLYSSQDVIGNIWVNVHEQSKCVYMNTREIEIDDEKKELGKHNLETVIC